MSKRKSIKEMKARIDDVIPKIGRRLEELKSNDSRNALAMRGVLAGRLEALMEVRNMLDGKVDNIDLLY